MPNGAVDLRVESERYFEEQLVREALEELVERNPHDLFDLADPDRRHVEKLGRWSAAVTSMSIHASGFLQLLREASACDCGDLWRGMPVIAGREWLASRLEGPEGLSLELLGLGLLGGGPFTRGGLRALQRELDEARWKLGVWRKLEVKLKAWLHGHAGRNGFKRQLHSKECTPGLGLLRCVVESTIVRVAVTYKVQGTVMPSGWFRQDVGQEGVLQIDIPFEFMYFNYAPPITPSELPRWGLQRGVPPPPAPGGHPGQPLAEPSPQPLGGAPSRRILRSTGATNWGPDGGTAVLGAEGFAGRPACPGASCPGLHPVAGGPRQARPVRHLARAPGAPRPERVP